MRISIDKVWCGDRLVGIEFRVDTDFFHKLVGEGSLTGLHPGHLTPNFNEKFKYDRVADFVI